MYKVHVNLPNRPDGSRVYVPGLGTYDNGSTTEIEDFVAERAFNKYPRIYSAVDGEDIFVGQKPAQEAPSVDMVSLDFPIEENE